MPSDSKYEIEWGTENRDRVWEMQFRITDIGGIWKGDE